ncbi:hypothetical protein HY768_07165 [candidate division TA06 bacterium]|uniref:Uncharacterized protein n=1 Tax=candidate division TA06 bacterium TaxID=2250710 RepID=A0A933IBN3_UNCT6|nr:hypothetical protein [candidate division TA06 bacterium]
MKISFKIGLITALVAGLMAVGIFLNHSFWEGKACRAALNSHAGTMAEMLSLSVQQSLLGNDFSALEYYLNQFNDRKDLAYVVVYDNVATPLGRAGGLAASEAIALYQANPRQLFTKMRCFQFTAAPAYSTT